MARVVLHTFGSLGDLHPYLAVAIGLRRRGHRAVVAGSEIYRAKVQSEDVDFATIRPDVGELLSNEQLLRRIWHPRFGTEYLIREYILPRLEESFEDLMAACEDADLLLTHTAGYAGPIVAEALELPWISVALQPTVFFSAYDPPVLAPAPWLHHLNALGRGPFKAVMAAARLRLTGWAEPIEQLRLRAGLARSKANPMLEGQFSPFGTLALFSKHFAQPQPDWPANVTVTGFPFYDRLGPAIAPGVPECAAAANELARFLEAGPPPIVFTLGSSAVTQAGTFYRESLEAARRLGMRAVLLIGSKSSERFAHDPPETIHVASYAPYSELLPKAAATVHQGGIGTTAQALRSGRPMLVVPWAHDQPDNAECARRLGVSRTIPRSRYTGERTARELEHLLSDPAYSRRAAEIGAKIAAEDGITAACGALEMILVNNAVPGSRV